MLSLPDNEKKKRSADSITLQEHMESIAAAGGRARAAKLSPARKSAIGKKAAEGWRRGARCITDEGRAFRDCEACGGGALEGQGAEEMSGGMR